MVCFLIILSAVIAVLGLIIAFARSDADLLLMFKARYGKQPESLAGKVVWITGASSGIGEYIAYCLAKAGCRLILSARRQQELEQVKQKCLQMSNGQVSEDDIMILPLNVTSYETHRPAVQKVIDVFNKIDILINNAGRSQRSKWMDVELNVDRELFEVNVLGPVSLTQEVLPHMIERKRGQVVVMSSLAGKFGIPHSRSYSGSKYAVHGYFECLRTEMGEHKIDVTMICPGPVHSNLFLLAARGKQGEVLNKPDSNEDKKMETDRCAYLSCVAIANKLYESWISEHPFLAFTYVNQYFPFLGQWYMTKMGVAKLMKLREGQ
uniref:Dehydrogenase/reductase SDR family member 7 n=1 Tax=Arion vulgaris TaxID=1028688 RepID=A0A0B7B9Y1_9EUPU